MPNDSRRSAQVLRLLPREPPKAPDTRRPTLDDAEILAAVHRGDASAAAAVYDRVRPHVARAVTRLLGHGDADAEDLAQLSIIEIVKSLASFRGDCALDTWVARITARTVFKELRRRQADRAVFDRGEPLTERCTPGIDIEDRAALRGILGRVRRHLGALDPVKSWTLLLHDVCGYDLGEIAVITEASVSAAQSRLVRGRAELQAKLERDPELASWLEQRREDT